jgi:hypothetical protein
MPDSENVNVPNLVGLTQLEAQAMLKNSGLVVGSVTMTIAADTPIGNVSASDPAVGESVSLGSAVNLNISGAQGAVPNVAPQTQSAAPAVIPNVAPQTQSAALVAVPNVVGLTRAAAGVMLKSAGLLLGAVKTQHSDSVPAGGISGTDPDVGMLVNPNSAVELDVSTGPEPNWTQYIPTALFALLGIIVLGLIVYGITQKGQSFLTTLADKEVARGLITFLIAIATVGIAIILAISTLILTEGDEGDKRFDRGKQVLSILIGVLGTIVGFYFGADNTVAKQPNPREQTQISNPKITPTTLADGTVNKPYPATTLMAAGLTGPLTWSVTPSLPAGLALGSATGTITGTPTASMPKTAFKFMVTDSGIPSVARTADLNLEINQ